MNKTGMTEMLQYLTYRLADEVFAVDVAKIREILDFLPATKVPGTPDFMVGVVNVRGNVVPVVDMRVKFGLPKTPKTVDTCIVVMEIAVDEETTVVGALVDSVQEVIELEAGQIEPAPRIGTKWRTEAIRGIGKRNNDLLIILDIDRVFSDDDLLQLQAGEEKASLGGPEAVQIQL